MGKGKRDGREGKRGGRDRGGGRKGGVCVIGVGGDRRGHVTKIVNSGPPII